MVGNMSSGAKVKLGDPTHLGVLDSLASDILALATGGEMISVALPPANDLIN